MKTFEDLEFKKVSEFIAQTRAKMFFKNGYGVSVITGGYGNESCPYELAVLFGDENNNELSYNTPVTNDVEGYLTSEVVTRLMLQVQALP